MKKKFKKILLIGVMVVIGLATLTSCNNISYNAVLFDHANEWMHIDFLRDNLTQGTGQFFNGYEWELISEEISLPAYRVHIVTNIEKFKELFEEFPPSIDFEREILIVYIVTNIYMGSSYRIRSLSLSNSVLSVELRRKRRRVVHAASAPLQRCFVIRMNKQNISEVNIALR